LTDEFAQSYENFRVYLSFPSEGAYYLIGKLILIGHEAESDGGGRVILKNFEHSEIVEKVVGGGPIGEEISDLFHIGLIDDD
jgi:hypothetical protein